MQALAQDSHDACQSLPEAHVSHFFTRVRRAGERSLLGVALALAACDDGAGEDVTEQPAGVPASESPAELGRGAEGPRSPRHMHICVNTLLPQPRARQGLPGWSPVVDAGPDDPELFDLTLEEALSMFQQNNAYR